MRPKVQLNSRSALSSRIKIQINKKSGMNVPNENEKRQARISSGFVSWKFSLKMLI